MFEHFTDHARRTLVLAQAEARELRHVNVGTHDLLIALMLLEDDIPARALAKLGVPLETARKNVEKLHFSAAEWLPQGDLPFTINAKKSLEFALREAMQFGDDFIGTEHLLLGIIRHDGDAVNDVYCVYPATVRQTVAALMLERIASKQTATKAPEEPALRSSDEISAEIESLNDRLRELKTELDAAVKRETGCDPSWHH